MLAKKDGIKSLEEKMNLRSDHVTEYQILVSMFSERSQNVIKRKEYEKVITDQNAKLVQQLQAILKPLAQKTRIGFHLSIQDRQVELSTMMIWKGRRTSIESRVSTNLPEINTWFVNTKSFESQLRTIEKELRALARISSSARNGGKITLSPPNTVTIGIDTRDRYF